MTDAIISPQLAKKIKSKGINLIHYSTKYLRNNFYIQYYYNDNDVLQHSVSYLEQWTPTLTILELVEFFKLDQNLFVDVISQNYVSYLVTITNTRNDKVVYSENFDYGNEEEMYLTAIEYIVDNF